MPVRAMVVNVRLTARSTVTVVLAIVEAIAFAIGPAMVPTSGIEPARAGARMCKQESDVDDDEDSDS